MKSIKVILLFFVLSSALVQAQEIQLGAQVGGVGNSKDSSIGFGGLFSVNPYGFMAFQIDGAWGAVSGDSFWYLSPSIIGYPINYEEFRIGAIGGAGFYGQPALSTRFGMNLGLVGEFSVLENFVVGTQARYHAVFGALDVWTMFITATYKFEADGGW